MPIKPLRICGVNLPQVFDLVNCDDGFPAFSYEIVFIHCVPLAAQLYIHVF